MRTYEEKEVVLTRMERLPLSVTCNKCGKTAGLQGEDYEREWGANEFQRFSLHFGYGSRYDMESWGFDLCEDCLTELIRTFKHVPDGFGQDCHRAKYPQIMFEKWKETGIVDLEAGMTPEEIAEDGGSIYVDIEEDE